MGTENRIRNTLFVVLVAVLLIFIAGGNNINPVLQDTVKGILTGTGAAAWAYVLLVILRGNGD